MSPSTLRDNPSPPRRERVQVDRLAVLRMRAAIPLPVVGQEEPVHQMEIPVNDDLAPYTARVSAIDEATPFPDVANVLGLIDEGIRRLRELKAEAEAVAVEQLRRDGPQVVGTVKYYAGPTKDHKCRDVRKTVDLLMGMDLATLGECLSTSAVKAGAFRKSVADAGKPELFGEHFETVEKWEMKEGKPSPKLQKVDTAFLKGGL